MQDFESQILIHYHEIALKGLNRSYFEKTLAYNIKQSLKTQLGLQHPPRVERMTGRIALFLEWTPKVQESLFKNFGAVAFSYARACVSELEAIFELSKISVQNHPSMKPGETGGSSTPSFRVRVKRTDKNVVPFESPELEKKIASRVLREFPTLRVDLKNPDIALKVEIHKTKTFISVEKIKGLGGLPVGSNAPVLTLLSGGIDSPVAALLAQRRGCSSSYIHFSGEPFIGPAAREKVEKLASLCNQYQAKQKPLFWVPFGDYQQKIALSAPPKIRTLLYRRLMLRISEQVAMNTGAQALVTGESIGQVASQTVENLSAIRQAISKIPILSPLISMDKDEIIHWAQKFGTYATSILPADDCCTLFSDRHPELRGDLEVILSEEAKLPILDWTEEGAQRAISLKID